MKQMDRIKGIFKTDQRVWTTRAYHGQEIHVSTALRAQHRGGVENQAQEWDYSVRITGSSDDQRSLESASAKSDPANRYATQGVAEGRGFIRGRELIEGLFPGLVSAD